MIFLILASNYYQNSTNLSPKKLPQKLSNQKSDVLKTVKQIQQNTCDKRNKKNTKSESLMKSRENETEKKPYINAGNYETKPKMRPKERNYRYCYAPNWNLNHKCPIREPTCHNCQKMDDSQMFVDFNTKNNKKSKKYQGHRQIDKHANQIIARN